MTFHDKCYLGDAVYVVRQDYGDLVLTTEDGVSETNRIVLDPAIYNSLMIYADKTLKQRQDELERRQEARS